MSNKEYFHIVDSKGRFATRISLKGDITFTDNPNLAYTYDSRFRAECMANTIASLPEYENEELKVRKA